MHHQFFEQNNFLGWFARYGWVGVDIFFVLSGYLISSLLMEELKNTGTINLRKFWLRRMLRLWPSWLVTLGFSILMVWFISRHNPELRSELLDKWWHYLFHLGNYSQAIAGKLHNFFSIFWSLSVEEHFYLFWPLILLLFRHKNWLLTSMILLLTVAWGFRYWHLTKGDLVLAKLATHSRIDSIIWGCLLTFVIPRMGRLKPMVEVVITLIMLTLFYLGLHYFDNNAEWILLDSLSFTVISLATCLLIIIALKGNRSGMRAVLSLQPLARLGVLSYGVYLIHLHVNYSIFALLKQWSVIQDQNLIMLINLIIPFVVAYIMFRFIDQHFAKYRP